MSSYQGTRIIDIPEKFLRYSVFGSDALYRKQQDFMNTKYTVLKELDEQRFAEWHRREALLAARKLLEKYDFAYVLKTLNTKVYGASAFLGEQERQAARMHYDFFFKDDLEIYRLKVK